MEVTSPGGSGVDFNADLPDIEFDSGDLSISSDSFDSGSDLSILPDSGVDSVTGVESLEAPEVGEIDFAQALNDFVEAVTNFANAINALAGNSQSAPAETNPQEDFIEDLLEMAGLSDGASEDPSKLDAEQMDELQEILLDSLGISEEGTAAIEDREDKEEFVENLLEMAGLGSGNAEADLSILDDEQLDQMGDFLMDALGIRDADAAEETGESEEPPAEEAGGAEEPPAEEAGGAEEPPAEEAGGAEEPPAEEAGGAEEPPAEEAGGAEEPPAEEAGGAEEPPAEEAGGSEEPPAEAGGPPPAEEAGGPPPAQETSGLSGAFDFLMNLLEAMGLSEEELKMFEEFFGALETIGEFAQSGGLEQLTELLGAEGGFGDLFGSGEGGEGLASLFGGEDGEGGLLSLFGGVESDAADALEG